MGSTSSTVLKKVLSPITHHFHEEAVAHGDPHCKSIKLASPLVLSRQGSMYFDEDDDLAHEFYVEEIHSSGGNKAKAYMKKVKNSFLRPQGKVRYPFPRLHTDFPVILYQG